MFEKRSNEPELLDDPNCPPELVHKSHRFMRYVNRYLGGQAVVKNFVSQYSKKTGKKKLDILDIGSGSCDIPISIWKWGRRKNIEISFQCVEREEVIIEKAKENIRAANADIKIAQSDIFRFEPNHEFDIAVGSLFFHHLSDQQILELISKLSRCCQTVLINDLHRSFLPYFGAKLLTVFLPKDVMHDALVSIRRAFKQEELKELLSSRFTNVRVEKTWFGRVAAVIEFENGDKK